MNFDQAKALRLQQWRSTLNNHEFRMQNPEAHRQTLHAMSQTLAAEGLVDPLEQFDMDELANAAYWHAVEELINAPPRYCGASSYMWCYAAPPTYSVASAALFFMTSVRSRILSGLATTARSIRMPAVRT